MVYELCLSILAVVAAMFKHVVSLVQHLVFIRIPHWRLPPGPLANYTPFFGSLPLFTVIPSHMMLTKIAEKYEKIFRLEFGRTTFVVITDHELLQEAFSKEVFCGRNMPPMMDIMDHKGLVHADGEFWKTQRAFVINTLKDLGLPRTNESKDFDNKANQAISVLLEELKNTNGTPIAVDEALCVTLVNIFFSMIVGKTFERYDQRMLSIIDSSHHAFRSTEPISVASFCSYIASLPGFAKNLEDIREGHIRFCEYMQLIVQDHREKLDPTNPKDLVDSFLIHKSAGERTFTETQLLSLLGDLFTASMESSVAVLHWMLLALVKFPEIQQKIVDQMREVTRDDRAPTLDDRDALPYLEAFILETYRFASVLPYGVPHATTEATTLAGFHIPKNSTVVGLFWKFNRDEKLWVDPHMFNPENHFKDGVLVRNKSLMPFSFGNRMCISETVANDVIFLILANILHKFVISPSDCDYPTPSMDESLEGVLRVPRFFKVRMVLREPDNVPCNSNEC